MRRYRYQTGVYLYSPNWDYSARVNGTGRSLMSVPVTGESSPIPPIVGEIAYVGTSARSWDVGITRVRSYSQGVIGVAENEIEWSPDLWIWCPRTFAPVAKIQRVSGTGERPTVWMDYDLDPAPLPPKVNVKGPLVVQPEETNYYLVTAFAVEQNAAITSQPSVSLYPDGSATTTSLPGGWQVAITFPTYGYKVAIVEIADTNGRIGRRIVTIMCGIEPESEVIVESLQWQMGGGVKVRATMPTLLLRPLQPAIFQYGPVYLPLWQIEPEMEITPDVDMVSVDLLSAWAMADKLVSHSMLFEDGGRSSWYSIPGLTARRAIHTMLEFHSTINEVANVSYMPGRLDFAIRSQQFHQDTLQRQINQLLANALSAAFEDLDGTIWIREEPMLMRDRSGTPVYSVTPISSIRESANPPIGQLQAGGFAYNTPYLARWPGTAPEIWSSVEEIKGLIVSDQDDLNGIAGMLASYRQTNDLVFAIGEDLAAVPPFGALWSSEATGDVQPLRASVRFSGVDPVMEVTAKRLVVPLVGETIIIPTEPPPIPIEYPPPPPVILPPPSAVTGYAFIRCDGFIARTKQIYSVYPHWEAIAFAADYPHPTDPNHVPRFIDFRYIEGPTVSIVASVSSGYVIRCDNPTDDNPTWTIIAGPDIFIDEPGDSFTIGPLMTMVQDYRHIGVFADRRKPDHSVECRYYYSEDYGVTWQHSYFRQAYVWGVGHWAPAGTAGTDQITLLYLYHGNAYSAVVQSNDRGRTWYYLSGGFGGFAYAWRIVKPWQYGVSGRIFYVSGTDLWSGRICGKSYDNLATAPETFNVPGYRTLEQGMEVWTFDPEEVHVIIRDETVASRWAHAVTFDGGNNWMVTYEADIGPPMPPVSLRGNPANNKEWTFVLRHSRVGYPMIYQTLDGGYSFDDLTGDWWETGGVGELSGGTPQDFLILPPFTVRTVREE